MDGGYGGSDAHVAAPTPGRRGIQGIDDLERWYHPVAVKDWPKRAMTRRQNRMTWTFVQVIRHAGRTDSNLSSPRAPRATPAYRPCEQPYDGAGATAVS